MRTGRLKPEFKHLLGEHSKKVNEPAEPIQALISGIKDDHAAFHAVHERIDDEIASAFTATEAYKPSPAVLGYVVKKLGLSAASTPAGVRKDLQALAKRFHTDRLKGIDETKHRRVVNLINSARDFLKHLKSFD